MNAERIRSLFMKFAPYVFAGAALATAGVAAHDRFFASDCCSSGSSCCHPGSPCCHGHAAAQGGIAQK